MNLKNIASKGLYIAFFMPLLGTALPAYAWFLMIILLLCLVRKAKIKPKDIFFLIGILLLFVVKLQQVGLPMTELLFRYFFGYVLVYIYCQVTGAEINIRKLIIYYCYEVLIEALLINTILPANLWLNYPVSNGTMVHSTNFFGFYQRPYSVGTNATISSVILVFLLLYYETLRKQNLVGPLGRKIDWMAALTIFSFVSGGGIVFYLFYWGYRLNLYTQWRNAIGLLLFIGICIGITFYASTLEANHALSKISSSYFEFLLEFKQNQIEDTILVLNRDSWYIGANYTAYDEAPLLWNDFSIRDLTHSLGLLGLLGLWIFLFSHMNRFNWIIGALAFLSTFHYGTIFALPGAIIMAYGLSLDKRKIHTFAL